MSNDEKRTRIGVAIKKELWGEIKKQATIQGMTARDLLEEILEDSLSDS